jgi:hypothetical protein
LDKLRAKEQDKNLKFLSFTKPQDNFLSAAQVVQNIKIIFYPQTSYNTNQYLIQFGKTVIDTDNTILSIFSGSGWWCFCL